MKGGERREKLQKRARDVGERIAAKMRENDPEKEKAYQAAAAKREAEVEKALAAHVAKRKK